MGEISERIKCRKGIIGMKKIIIFEDSLENTIAYVKELHEMPSVSEIYILLYCVDKKAADDKIGELSDKFPQGTHIEKVTLWDYEEKLDEFYVQPDTLFLFDMNLYGDGSTVFNNRINVVYAKKKRELPHGKHPKIWFYTTTKAEQRAVLLEQFPECTLHVRDVGKDGVELEFDHRFQQAMEDA